MIAKFVATVIGDKKQWRQYKARSRRLPPSYRTALDALERYLNFFGTGGDGTALYGDLIDLLEQGAAAGTPIRAIIGTDPVGFIETFVQNYPQGHWIVRERQRLVSEIDRAATEEDHAEEDRAEEDHAEEAGNASETGKPATGKKEIP